MDKPLKEHFEVDTDGGTMLRAFDYIEALEKYIASPPNDSTATCEWKTSVNTDIEIWRKVKDDYYSPAIHVTELGNIGINVGGHVLVAPIEEWHKAGNKLFTVNTNLKNC